MVMTLTLGGKLHYVALYTWAMATWPAVASHRPLVVARAAYFCTAATAINAAALEGRVPSGMEDGGQLDWRLTGRTAEALLPAINTGQAT